MTDPKTKIAYSICLSDHPQEFYENASDFLRYSKWYKRFCYFPLNLTVIFFWLALGFYSAQYLSVPLITKTAYGMGMGLFGCGIILLLRISYRSRIRHFGNPLISNSDNPMTITFSEGTLKLMQGDTQNVFREENGLLLKPYRSIMIIKTKDRDFFLPRRLFTPEALELLGAPIF